MNFSKTMNIFYKTVPFEVQIKISKPKYCHPCNWKRRNRTSLREDSCSGLWTDRWPSDAQILYYSSSELWKFKETINYKNLNCWLQCDRRMWMYFNAFFFFLIWNWIFWPLIFCNKSQRCELPRFPSIFSFCDCEYDFFKF